MKFLLFLAFSTSLFAQGSDEDAALSTAAAAGSKSLFVIEPKARSNDYVQAFDLLRKDKPTLKIMIQTTSGMVLGSVTEITATQNGTLLLVKYASNSGNKYQIVPVENMLEIGYSPS